MDTDLRDMFERYVAVLNAHAFERLAEFLHEEVTVNGEPVSRPQVIDRLRAQIASMPDFAWRVENVVVEGSAVAARLINRGTPTTAWLGANPTGATIEYAGIAFHKVRAGRFYDQWYVVDVLTAQRQLADASSGLLHS